MSQKVTRRQMLAMGATGLSAIVPEAFAEDQIQQNYMKVNADLEDAMSSVFDLQERGLSLNNQQKCLVLLAAAASSQSNAFEIKRVADLALSSGIKADSLQEALYQCTPYIGLGRNSSAIEAFTELLLEKGLKLPFESRTTVKRQDRMEKGLELRIQIYGDPIRQSIANAAKEARPIIRGDLSAWCFGSFYTRGGLSLAERELVVFTALVVMGLNEQLKGHIIGNLKVGNTKQNLYDAVQISIPYSGCPRALNALALIAEVTV